MKHFIISLFSFLLITPLLNGQAENTDDTPDQYPDDVVLERNDFYLNVNFGGYFANNYTTTRYDGADFEYDYDFGITRLFDNQFIYNQIYESYGQRNFQLAEIPADMKYNIGIQIGGGFGYYLNENTAIFLDGDIINLKTVDAITIQVEDPANQLAEPTLEVEQIIGTEKRLQIALGLHGDMGEDLSFTPYYEIGVNLIGVRAEKNEVIIQNNRYTLTQWSRNSTAYQNVDFGGFSYGAQAGLGLRIKFNKEFSFDLGGNLYYHKIDLGPDQIHKFRLQGNLYLRLLWL